MYHTIQKLSSNIELVVLCLKTNKVKLNFNARPIILNELKI